MRVEESSAALRPKLQIDGLCKTYGNFVALHPTSFGLRSGEFLTLLGPSGSGKTTLLMMVAGLTEPSGGDIWIDGQRSTYAPAFHRDIGMVFQNYALFPHLTVAENIGFPLRMRRRPGAEIEREVKRVLELVQLPHVAQHMPRQLSGGQQQRIALARCIVYSPSIILMDEPLGALDKKLRDQLQIEIKRLHRQLGTTILYVTHDQQEALTMSDRVCLMNHGCVEQLGPPGELYFRPLTLFAADFLGESNIFRARVVTRDGDQVTLESPELCATVSSSGPIPVAIEPGGALRLMVRPERMRLASVAQPGWNSVPAVVTDVIFTGGVTRTIVRCGERSDIAVADLTEEGALATEAGRKMMLQWRPQDTVLLPDAPAFGE